KVVLAAPAALHYCLEHDIAPPRWVAEAALLLLCDLLKREKSKRRGRAGGSVARYRQDMIDFLRWNEVDVLRNEQQRSKRLMSEYPVCPAPRLKQTYDSEVEKAKWLGTSAKRLYECVSEVIEQTEAFGSAESIKRSYRQVQRNNRHPSE